MMPTPVQAWIRPLGGRTADETLNGDEENTMAEVRKLHDIDEVDQLIEASHEKPVLIFKHSLICPISGMAYREYERYLADLSADDGGVHTLIEIQNARPVSNAVAEKTGVRHESPQALLVRDGKVVWHQSHSSIRTDALSAAIAG